jgi:GNAT superfamily N-acetyltransferase
MQLAIRQATPDDTQLISDILLEAARWLRREGMPMWRDDELLPERLSEDVAAGSFFIGEIASEAVATIRFQCIDPAFWPDVPADESAFVHRIAVRRRLAGCGVSAALLRWAAERAQALGRRYLRLDCEASRPRLRAVYERFGFRHHSDRQVGPYFVSRYELLLFSANGSNQSLEPTAGCRDGHN